eukprot:951136-Pyramimonas_sp.AAC.1
MLQVSNTVSTLMGIGMSILAGCSQSLPWIDCSWIHWQVRGSIDHVRTQLPRVTVYAHVDDTTLKHREPLDICCP